MFSLVAAFGQTAAAQGRDSAQARLLWEEFSEFYSGNGLARLEPAELEKQALAALRTSPEAGIYRSQLQGDNGLLPAVVKLANLRKISPFDAMEGAIEAFCKSRSPFETYMTLADRNQFEAMGKTAGAGAGMQLNRDSAGRYTLSPFTGSPAEKAGVRDGDELIEVAGKGARDLSIPMIRSLVIGPLAPNW